MNLRQFSFHLFGKGARSETPKLHRSMPKNLKNLKERSALNDLEDSEVWRRYAEIEQLKRKDSYDPFDPVSIFYNHPF